MFNVDTLSYAATNPILNSQFSIFNSQFQIVLQHDGCAHLVHHCLVLPLFLFQSTVYHGLEGHLGGEALVDAGNLLVGEGLAWSNPSL